jgi:ATP-dependent Clp protease adaptor protein ClpS
VHNGGEGLCGIYTKEIAESKVQAATEFAKANKQPLRTVMKPV